MASFSEEQQAANDLVKFNGLESGTAQLADSVGRWVVEYNTLYDKVDAAKQVEMTAMKDKFEADLVALFGNAR